MAVDAGVQMRRDGAVLRVELNRPEKLNAQTPATWRALADIPALADDPNCELIILTGRGDSFSAGLDRAMFGSGGVAGETSLIEVAKGTDHEIDSFIQAAQAGFTWPDVVRQPVVAYVQGHAIGAGCQLALAADIIVVAPDVQMALRETSLGLVPDLGITGPLVAALGYPRAFEFCATGRVMGADELFGSGLVTSIIARDAWASHEAGLVTALAQIPSGSVAELKNLLRGATFGADQRRRERMAQINRLRALAADLMP